MTNIKPRICPECGSEFTPKRAHGKPQFFCSREHKDAHSARRAARGKALAAIAQGWRKTRGSGELGKFLFADMTSMLDRWNTEDREAGRMSADEYAQLVTDFHAVNPAYHGGQTHMGKRHIDRLQH